LHALLDPVALGELGGDDVRYFASTLLELAVVEVALVSAASARCNAEGRWRELAALGLAGSLPLAALLPRLPRRGLGPRALAGLAAGLPSRSAPGGRRALAPLSPSAAFSLLGLVLGPLSSLPLALFDLLLLHLLNVLRLRELPALAKAALKSL
jgi:hypothetical protein